MGFPAAALGSVLGLGAAPAVGELAAEFISPRFFYELFGKEALGALEGPPPKMGWLYLAVGLVYLAVLVYFFWRFSYLQQLKDSWVKFRRRRASDRVAKAERLKTLKEAEAEAQQVSYDAFHALAEANRAFDEGRFEEALAGYEEAARLSPALPAAWVGRGAALGRLARRAEAQGSFRRALDMEPANAEAWVNLGLVALQEDDGVEAQRAFGQAVALDASQARGHYGLAALAARRADGAEAKEHLKRALGLKPSLAAEASRDPAFTSLPRESGLQELLGRYSPKVSRLRPAG